MNSNDQNVMLWMQNWYERYCDGDWEHQYGIRIETLDNPGWFVTIDLNETFYENINFTPIKVDKTENDWFHCSVKDKKFEGAGGPKNLNDILETFNTWIKKNKSENQI